MHLVSGGVGFNAYLPISLWLAMHLYEEPTRPSLSMEYHATARGFRDGILRVEQADADLCLINSRVLASMALRGVGLFSEPATRLRGLATFPHDDWCVFGVSPNLGVRSFRDLAEKRPPLRLTTGFLDGDNVVGFLALEVLRRHGVDPDALASWGGDIIEADLRTTRENIETDNADAIYQEAAHSPKFRALAQRKELHFLTIEPDVASAMEEEYGLQTRILPRGFYAAQEEPLLVIDLSAWILCAREDLDDDIAGTIARLVVEHGSELESNLLPTVGATFRSTLPPVRAEDVPNTLPLPLHPGAQRAYEKMSLPCP